MHYLLKTYAQMCGFQTMHASVGERVLEMVRQYHPSLILLNINLPGSVRGWEVLRSLKNDELTRAIPIVIYDSGVFNQDRLDSRRGEADACLPMPVLYEGFKETLMSVGVEIHPPVNVRGRNTAKVGRHTRRTDTHSDSRPPRRSKKPKEEQ